jgi:hypothetical protein
VRPSSPPSPPRGTDIAADPAQPTVGLHWGVLAAALAVSALFVAAMIYLFAGGDGLTNFLLAIVAGFAMVFFGLTLGLGRWAADDPRWQDEGRRPTLEEFAHDNVATATGVIAGREAMVQILTLPIVLAVGGAAIGIVFRLIS